MIAWLSGGALFMLSPLPWFGPRGGAAWGWAPLTWEGGVITLLCIAVCLGAYAAYGKSRRAYYIVGASISLLLVICALTGTPPG
jgi:hypothetical protein